MTVKNLKKKVDNLIEPAKPKGPIYTCFFCGARLSEEKLTKRIKEVEDNPALYSVVRERYGEVFNFDEEREDG